MNAPLTVTKLYADLVTDDAGVAICYLGWLELLGIRRGYAAVELYDPAGGRQVLHAPLPEGFDCPTRPSVGLDVTLATDRGRVRFWHEPRRSVVPAAAQLRPALSWQVVTPAADASVRWLDGGGQTLCGSGYADWVVLRRPTRALGLRTLRWGRALVGTRQVVFARVVFRSGESWSQALSCDGDGEVRPLALRSVDSTSTETVVEFDDGEVLELAPIRALHEGSAFDGQRFPNAAERGVLRLASGRVAETRWVSRAGMAGSTGLGLHEAVEFG